MPLPSLQVMGIAANGDPYLFRELMAKAGFSIVPQDNDPLNNQVQAEAVSAVASAITEDTYQGVRLSPYHKQLKTLAERAGYVVMIENCGPPGEDPCEGELGDEQVASMGGPEAVGSEVEQIAALPIGTELAAEILAVIKGEGPAALDMGAGDEVMMGGEELPPEGEEMMGGEEELPPPPEGEEMMDGEEEMPPEGGEEEIEGRPF